MMHPDDRPLLKDKIKECLKYKRVNGIECRVIRENNERLLRIDAYLSREDGTNIIVGHAEDITATKAYNNNLQNHNSIKNSILNILAHDLSGPIGTIGNLAELMQKETHYLNNQNLEKYISMINKITTGAMSLIRNFINQEFLESQAVNLIKTRVELLTRLTNATQEYFNMAPDLNLTFFCEANKEAIYVDIDEDKFMQVINNLISNSMKFTPDGGKISIFIEEREKSVLITVSDTGIGIPAKYHQTLFDKFTNARRSGLKGQHSNGLGMSIIKTIIELHQGRIWFESEENKGTTFFIELPR